MTPGLHAACPHCEAVFLLEEAQLNAREGLVCCGACGEIFNAKWYLTEQPDREAAGNAPEVGAAPGDSLIDPEVEKSDCSEIIAEHQAAGHQHATPRFAHTQHE